MAAKQVVVTLTPLQDQGNITVKLETSRLRKREEPSGGLVPKDTPKEPGWDPEAASHPRLTPYQ